MWLSPLISRPLSELHTKLTLTFLKLLPGGGTHFSACSIMKFYQSIYVQIVRSVEGEMRCYCGALDIIDFSVFSIMSPPAAIFSKCETSLLYLQMLLIRYPPWVCADGAEEVRLLLASLTAKCQMHFSKHWGVDFQGYGSCYWRVILFTAPYQLPRAMT